MVTIISAIATPIITGVVVWVITHTFSKREAAREQEVNERAELRKKELHLSLRLNFAVMEMSYANSMAILRGEPNGEVEEAVKKYNDTKAEYLTFINETHTDIVKG